MVVLLLGPSRWRPRYRPEIPRWLREALPLPREVPAQSRLSPLAVRASLTRLLAEIGKLVTVMETHTRLP